MRLGKTAVGVLSILLLAACSSSTSSESTPTESTTNQNSYAEGIKSLIEEFKGFLAYDLDRSNYLQVDYALPYFSQGEPSLIFDADWNKLEIALPVSFDENREWDKGQSTAIPVQDNGVLPKLTGWKEVCAKNTMRNFLQFVSESMQMSKLPMPKESLKLQINFYIDYLVKKGKENKFGNIEGEIIEERELTMMIHLSRANLELVNPTEANDIFALSDIEEPIRPPSRWNSCREYFLN